MRRNRFSHFMLVIVALGILLAGYFLGNRYRYAELRDLPVQFFSTPTTLNAALLSPDLRAQAGQGAWLILLPGIPNKACDALLEHYVAVYNRLAAEPALQAKMRLVLLSDSNASASVLWRHIEWARLYQMNAAQFQPLVEALQLTPAGNRWCLDVQATTALVGPDLHHYALLPLDEPGQMALNLQTLIRVLGDSDK